VRRGTGLPARAEFKDAAIEIRRKVEAEYVDAVVFGKKPSRALGVAARQYLGISPDGTKLAGEGKELAWSDLQILRRAIRKFGVRPLDEISGEEWTRWIKAENRGNAASTIKRFAAPLKAFLRWSAQSARGWLKDIPDFDLASVPRVRHRERRRVGELYPDLLVFLFDHAPIHLKAQVYTEWSTGARVSSVLFGCRLCDLILAPGRNQITFHDTKNGDSVTAHLHQNAAEIIALYLDWRGRLDDREGPLFLTDRRRPYSARGREHGWGSENKTAWRGMVRRAVKAKRREAAAARVAGERDRGLTLWAEARLLRQVTQHWLRHWFATHALAAGMDLRAIAEQGGWRDYRSIQGYSHDVPDTRRRAVEALPIGATPDTKTGANAKIGTTQTQGPRRSQ
jgi:site-specific recombinase XerD